MGNDLILHISGLSMWTPATPPPPTVITTTLTRTQTFSRMETHQNPPVTVSWRELSYPAQELCRKSREFTCDLQCCSAAESEQTSEELIMKMILVNTAEKSAQILNSMQIHLVHHDSEEKIFMLR